MKLSIFDYDGTLVSHANRWIESTVAAMHRAVDNGDYVVVLTGRPIGDTYQIGAALASRALRPHEIIAVGPLNILDRKRAQIRRLLRSTAAGRVELWDDHREMLADYGRMLDMMRVPNTLKWVK